MREEAKAVSQNRGHRMCQGHRQSKPKAQAHMTNMSSDKQNPGPDKRPKGMAQGRLRVRQRTKSAGPRWKPTRGNKASNEPIGSPETPSGVARSPQDLSESRG